jgi:hypothetical protein
LSVVVWEARRASGHAREGARRGGRKGGMSVEIAVERERRE